MAKRSKKPSYPAIAIVAAALVAAYFLARRTAPQITGGSASIPIILSSGQDALNLQGGSKNYSPQQAATVKPDQLPNIPL